MKAVLHQLAPCRRGTWRISSASHLYSPGDRCACTAEIELGPHKQSPSYRSHTCWGWGEKSEGIFREVAHSEFSSKSHYKNSVNPSNTLEWHFSHHQNWTFPSECWFTHIVLFQFPGNLQDLRAINRVNRANKKVSHWGSSPLLAYKTATH